MAATSTSSFTVVFVGTENGKIKKIVVEGASSAQEYDEVKIDPEGGAVGKDLMFDKKEMNLYVMTKKRVSENVKNNFEIFLTVFCEICPGVQTESALLLDVHVLLHVPGSEGSLLWLVLFRE